MADSPVERDNENTLAVDAPITDLSFTDQPEWKWKHIHASGKHIGYALSKNEDEWLQLFKVLRLAQQMVDARRSRLPELGHSRNDGVETDFYIRKIEQAIYGA